MSASDGVSYYKKPEPRAKIGRPTKYGEDRISTALRLPKSLHERLTAAADDRDVGVNWLICRLLDESLARLIPVAELTLTRASVEEPPS